MVARVIRWFGIVCFTLAFAANSHGQRAGGFLGFGASSCILNYVSEPARIQRFDICTGQALPDFYLTQLPDPRGAQQVQNLPDGGLLVSNVSVIARFSADATLVRVYDKPGEDCWSGLALESSGSAFWASSSCHSNITRFELTPDAHMFGGGTQFTSAKGQVNYGMDLHCDAGVQPNYLQVIWDDATTFVMKTMTSASCTGSPFNTHSGTGTGEINGQPGAQVRWAFVDNGQPGVLNDTGRIAITNAAGETVLEISGKIYSGSLIAR
jgi:hypothetical protein